LGIGAVQVFDHEPKVARVQVVLREQRQQPLPQVRVAVSLACQGRLSLPAGGRHRPRTGVLARTYFFMFLSLAMAPSTFLPDDERAPVL
jgi:hypothetical protein